MDALALLHQEHRRLVERLDQFERAADNSGTRRRLAGEITELLRRHVADEEAIFYAALRRHQQEQDSRPTDTATRQHTELGRQLDELDKLPSGDGSFDARMAVLVEQTRRHLDHEDATVLTAAEETIDDQELIALGERMEERARVVAAQEELAEAVVPAGGTLARVTRVALAAAAGAVIVVAWLAARSRARAPAGPPARARRAPADRRRTRRTSRSRQG
jgi:hemerythrin-like domain-containing protein